MAIILVIDDELDLRLLVRVILERKGHEVIEAASGGEGLELLRQGGHDLVILDLRLPDMDGIEVLKRIKSKSDATAVIVLTAHSSGHARKAAEAAGSDGYLSKPFDNKDLLEIVERSLNRTGRLGERSD